jgi:hypothetical protein
LGNISVTGCSYFEVIEFYILPSIRISSFAELAG